jgi:hypothetical protein
MKKFSNNFILIVLALTLTQCRKEQNINNAAYAIGTIDDYTQATYGKSSHPSSVSYNFIINGIIHLNNYDNKDGGKGWAVPASGDYNAGDEFMVQYDKTNPDGVYNSRILFNYPVSDSSNYRSYVAEFLTDPPN